ncbi:glmZ(sRNA)-inactivating NTPase [Knoellia sinensis KCTC 19936]|uniref:GlmZ(SRNA)-inactivating NTPase n=1 Tax=Knoellia sinensis KCTC 19936 TaxID=1385520 RepID=A0A0A0J728_9MICO|nr:RNase adapter RapZ [Knoellia sinensis]KGN32564.1 glmZ(sRNA)-inactivating NTPase [Knoellia sinensis KCTC 19936]
MPEPATPETSGADFVIVTGMSGAGRSTTANVMEDQGWYVVDNLPPQLLVAMAELGNQTREAGHEIKIAAVVDVRSKHFFPEFEGAVQHLKSTGWTPQLVFLDATDEALVRRFESVRRPHPLQGDGRLLDGIQSEREVLRDLRSRAQIVIDTSGLNVHQLARKIAPLFGAQSGPSLRLALLSFGFKYGVPLDADFVFDMRFLPNPFWVPELRALDGRDASVSAHVLSQDGAAAFLDRVVALMEPVTQGYHSEGRRYVTLAIGCTGGKHRSVAMAEALSQRLSSDSIETFLVHRDLGRE